jgi:hypothetical protein
MYMNKWVRRFLYFLAGILALLIIAFLFLQTRPAKNLIRTKLQAYISKKTNTEFVIGSLDYRLPTWVELNGVLMRDQGKDTLIFGNRIKADISMLKLLNGKYEVQKIELNNMYVNLTKKDSVFNFEFVINAFKKKSANTQKEDTSLIDLSLKELILKDIRFNMLDDKSGSYTRMSVKDLELRVNNLDINKLSFDVEKLYADQLRLVMVQQRKWTDTSQVTTAAVWPTIKADSLILKNSIISYTDEAAKLNSVNTIGQLELVGLNNLEYRKLLKGKSIELSNSDIRFDHVVAKAVPKTIIVKDTLIQMEDVGVIIDSIDLLNNKITYNNNSMPVKINGMDYAHFAVKDLKLKALNTSYQNEIFQSTIAGFSFRDKSGFQLDSLSGFVRLDSGLVELKDLYVKTPSSILQAQATIYPVSLTNPSGGPFGLPQNNVVLTNTILSKKDLELLAETLTRTYGKQLDAMGDLLINADIKGDAKRLFVRTLDARSVSGKPFRLQVSGTLNNVSDPRYLTYNLNVANVTATKEFFQPYLEKSATPINWPQLISASGVVSGGTNNIKTNLRVRSSFGNAVIAGTLANFADPARMRYDLNIQAQNLETGKWIFDEEQLGKLTGNIRAKGNNGFDIKRSTISTSANISSIRVQEFVFNNIRGTVKLSKGLADFDIAINDPKVQGTARGNANLKTQYPAVDAYLDLRKADMKALGLSSTDMVIGTLARIDLKNSSPENLEAYFRLDSTRLKTPDQEVFSDSAIIEAFVRNDSTIVDMISDHADANIATNLDYQQLPKMLSEVMSYYYKTGKPVAPAPQGTMLAYVSIKPSAYLQTIVKDLSFKNAQIDAVVTNSNRDSSVKANLVAEQLQLGTNKIANLEATFSGAKDTLLMVMKADTVKAGNILLFNATAKAGLANNNLTAEINSSDAENKPQYAIAFDASSQPDRNGYRVKLKNGLLLNYNNWQVNENNQFILQGKAFNVRDFDISNNQQKISLNSTSSALGAPVLVSIDNFRLSTVTAAMDRDSLQLDGLVNADFTVSDFTQTIPSMDGSLKLDSIIYQHLPVGNLDLKANSSGSQVTVAGKLDGNGNNVDINGRYNANNIDLSLNLNPLSLASVEPFTLGNFVRSSGTLTGPLSINGPVDKPTWNGRLLLTKVNTTLAAFGTNIIADGQTIVLEYPAVKLNNFQARDSLGNTLNVNGNITQNAEGNFIADLALSTKNFTAINNSANDNNFLFGKAIVSLDATLTGDILYPELSGNVSVKNGTELTYVQQTIPSSLKEREKLLEFIDMDTIANLQAKNRMVAAEGMKKITRTAGSLVYNLNLDVDPEAKLSIILDPATRDELQVQGSAQINAVVNPNGTVGLAGTYNLRSGSYVLNYGPVQRKFILQPGGTLTMSGDPLNAVIDVTAIYEINAVALDLIGNEIGGGTAVENNIYRRKVPFQVLLKITGVVSEPQLSFDIVIKERAEGVSYDLSNTINNKLDQLRTDPSLMNKQVFALLAFNRFIGDQSSDFFAGNGIVNSGLLANASVSGFLNAAVEQLANDLIKGVDLDLTLEEVDTDPNATRTDLNVSLARTFLDDRLNVTFGKNFTIAGDESSGKAGNTAGNSMQFLPDINATYKLSKDGRYMLRAYRRNQYEAIMDGYFIETGLAFSVSMDYGKFKELVRRKKK